MLYFFGQGQGLSGILHIVLDYNRKLYIKAYYSSVMDLKSIVKEQKEELKTVEREERIIARENLDAARKYLRYPNILAILVLPVPLLPENIKLRALEMLD